MQRAQSVWHPERGWVLAPRPDPGTQWVLVFGAATALAADGPLADLRKAYPDARITGCTTAGEIAGASVQDDGLVATAVHFEGASIQVAAADVQPDSQATGRALVAGLPSEGLRHVIILSDGLGVNGSRLAHGLRSGLPPGVAVTGGLAGDGARFERTLTVLDDDVRDGRVLAIGLYGRLHVGYGSLGGWDPFGPQRRVTKAKGNVLYELDGQPALTLYKRYLGEHVAGLPATGLLFPLSLDIGAPEEVVRTILSIDEDAQSLTFAGDVPQGAKARLMKANFDRLVSGASGAATHSRHGLEEAPELAILISCVGRKLVLKQRTEDELEAVRHVLGPDATLCGFYSYGEICPSAPDAGCELHNQTMTITTVRET